MPRKPRIHAPGAVYHVILRGNARQKVFADNDDRIRFCAIVANSCQRFHHRIVAFCLMSNHIHLALQVAEIPLSRIMQNISLRYTQWFNRRHSKCGHLFQGRYKAVMVDADAYLLELVAYIHLNPVRAGMTDQPEKHRWSSHRSYLGKEKIEWLAASPVLSLLSTNTATARSMFSALVAERIAEGRRVEFHGEKTPDSRVFGEDRFVEEVLTQAGSRPERRPDMATVLDSVLRMYGMAAAQLAARGQKRLAAEARGLAAWAVRELSAGTIAELAAVLKRDPSTLTCAAARVENRLIRDAILAEKVRHLRREVQVFKA